MLLLLYIAIIVAILSQLDTYRNRCAKYNNNNNKMK